MSTVYQGSSDTAAIQKGATGAQNALVIPFENSNNPAVYLDDIPNLRLIRVNQNTNFPEYWDGTAWVVIGSNTEISSVNFKIGDPDVPANGSTAYTLPDEFEGQAIEIFASDLGRFLIAGEDYSRSGTYGLIINLLNGNQFLDGGYWFITGGMGVGANAIQKEKYTLYTQIPTGGQDALILCDQDNSSNGDNTESQFIRQNNKLFYLVAVEA